MTKNGDPLAGPPAGASPMSWSAQMFGWFSAEMLRASRAKRSRNCGSRGENRGQNLDCHDAFQPGVAGAIHLAHAARTKRRHDFVRTEPISRRQRHGGDYKQVRELQLTGRSSNRTNVPDRHRSPWTVVTNSSNSRDWTNDAELRTNSGSVQDSRIHSF